MFVLVYFTNLKRSCINTCLKTLGQTCMVTGGGNLGRVGTFMHRNRHSGSFDIVEIKDKTGQSFATRLDNVFVLGKVNLKAFY